jgi:tRNA-binding protein
MRACLDVFRPFNAARGPIVPRPFEAAFILCLAMSASPPQITFEDFLRVDVRVGRIVDVQPFPAARKPAFQLTVDFGPEIGHKRSSAQLTQRYAADDLLGRQVLAVVNFPPRQIATFFSQVLVLGVPDEDGNVVLIEPQAEVPLGGRLF